MTANMFATKSESHKSKSLKARGDFRLFDFGLWTMVIVCILSFLSMTGCGYTTASLLPASQDSIFVGNFANKIDLSREVSDRRNSYSYRPGLENDITRAIIDEFIRDRHLDVHSENDAVLFLEGELIDFKQYPLSYSGQDVIEEFRMEITVNVSLYDNSEEKLLWTENGFMGETSYIVSGPNRKTQSQALKSVVTDLARRIVERTIERW